MIAILVFIFMIALIVIVHEWGHYITAKKNGVLVREFAVGMGPKIWSIQKGETLYSFRIFPIGGFCNMEEEIGDTTDNPRAMCSKKPWQKLLIVSFGAIMNFIFAWVLLTILAGYMGYGTNVIQTLDAAMPAQEANLRPGDKIIAIDGYKVKDLSDIKKISEDKNKSYQFTILRDGQEPFNVELKAKQMKNEKGARFGFAPEKVHFNIFYNIKEGFTETLLVIQMVWEGFIKIVTGQVPLNQVASIVGVGGLSVQQWNESVQSGGVMLAIMNMIYLAALISANLGVVNLLPIPALDGGRIIFILVEMVRGKPLDSEKEAAIHFVGFVLLMMLTIVVVYNDVVKMAWPK